MGDRLVAGNDESAVERRGGANAHGRKERIVPRCPGCERGPRVRKSTKQKVAIDLGREIVRIEGSMTTGAAGTSLTDVSPGGTRVNQPAVRTARILIVDDSADMCDLYA